MIVVPKPAEPVVGAFASCFSHGVFARLLELVVGLILTPRRRCVTSALRLISGVGDAHFVTYYRVLSRAQWSLWKCARVLARMVMAFLPEDEPIILSVDDTVARHKGPKVYGRCCHRDPVRSSHGITVLTWGHRWVVMAITVRLPFTSKPIALPLLLALYRSKKWCKQHGRRFKSCPQLARQLMIVMLRWFPQRKFVLLGDGGFSTFDLASLASQHHDRLTLVTRFYDDAALCAKPRVKEKYGFKMGRPARYGTKLMNPAQTVAKAGDRLTHANVCWYGGGRRDVRLLSGVGGWYRSRFPIVGVRWVFVKDTTGTHRDEYLMSTDPRMTADQIVSLYTLRWPLEVTFQEARLHLGIETPRLRSEKAVLRMMPLLMGLFTLIHVIYMRLGKSTWTTIRQWPWYRKSQPTFSDIMAEVREAFWKTSLNQTLRNSGVSGMKSSDSIYTLIRTLSLAG
jgi:hypothetical protein